MRNKTYNKRKILIVFLFVVLIIAGLIGRLVYLMVFEAPYYQEQAEELHERERDIKAARGEILDVKWNCAGHKPHRVYHLCDPQPDHGSGAGDPGTFQAFGAG